MYWTMLSVELPGPPLVMMCTGSKIWNAPMNEMTVTKNRDGDSSGSLIRISSCHQFAPSILAASTRLAGIIWSPASKTMNEKPTVCHRSTPMMVASAVWLLVNSCRLCSPSLPR
jgi:hypothetical protein